LAHDHTLRFPPGVRVESGEALAVLLHQGLDTPNVVVVD